MVLHRTVELIARGELAVMYVTRLLVHLHVTDQIAFGFLHLLITLSMLHDELRVRELLQFGLAPLASRFLHRIFTAFIDWRL